MRLGLTPTCVRVQTGPTLEVTSVGLGKINLIRRYTDA